MSATALLLRPRSATATITMLQLVASGATALLAFAVALLACAYWRVDSEEAGYRILSLGLVGMLLVPLVALGSASARLAARSRDERLATLRLLGASAGRVRRIAVAEVTVVAAIGVAAGTALAAALPAALTLVPVHGERQSASEIGLPWWIAAAIPPALVAVAAGSALAGLRRVVLTPLGVRTRQDAPRLSRLRLVIALGVLAAAVVLVQLVSPGWGVAVIVCALGAVVLAVMAVLGVAGPFALSVVARRTAARASDPARLIAARGVHDDPRAAWRSVSALVLATFVLIPAGSLLGYLDTIGRSASREIMTREQLLLFGDARTMLLALVAVSFVVVACQVAITQTASVLEDRHLHIALDRMGMPFADAMRARRLRVMMPAFVAVTGSAVAAVALVLPLVGIATAVAPAFIAAIVAVLVLGLLLIRMGASATAPVLRRVLAAVERGE